MFRPQARLCRSERRTQAFTASVTDTPNTTVSWEVNQSERRQATLGTISSAGVYTPPATVSAQLVVTVTATSDAVSTQTGSAQVTVSPAPSSGGSGGSSGGGGGGAIDLLTLAAGLMILARRVKLRLL